MNSNVLEAVRSDVWSSASDTVWNPIENAVGSFAEMSVEATVDKDVWNPTAATIYSSVYAAIEIKLDEYEF